MRHISAGVEHGRQRENGKVDQVQQQHANSANAVPALDPLLANRLKGTKPST